MVIRRRVFSEADNEALLTAVRECRTAAVTAITRAPINSDGARALSDLLRVLDELTAALTGDRQRFWTRTHATPQGRGS